MPGTTDLWLGDAPFNEWADQQQDLHRLFYITALRDGDLNLEASRKDILLKTGFDISKLEELQRQALMTPRAISLWRFINYEKQVVIETTDIEVALRVLADNSYVPPVVKKDKKKSKKSQVDTGDIASVALRDHWMSLEKREETVKSVTNKPQVDTKQEHPADFTLVHLPKSSVIHYSKGKKSTLCGKKWDRLVKPEIASDPLYDICKKCQAEV